MSDTTAQMQRHGPVRTGRRVAARGIVSAAVAAAVVGAAAGVARADVTPGPGYDALTDKGSLYDIAEVIGAHDAYRSGITGKGVGVALIDTGVAAVPGLTSGNVVNGPDLSFDSQAGGPAYVDSYGHGTHLASIIAGRDVAGSPSSYLDPSQFTGIAPDATLLNVKVGGSDGVVDVSQVIAGIDWVVAHANDNGMHIRVINLSYGTDSVQSSLVDPLAYAVENAWKRGIVVVVAGGNDGETSRTLADPASDPHVIAVGALDDGGTASTDDDSVPAWSTHGTAQRHVDVVAPGVSVLGLRVPGGTVDQENPQAEVAGRFERGSGTSMAAAVVSGEAALLLQAKPGLTPDQVKEILTDTATGLPRTSEKMAGSGGTDLRKALAKIPAVAPAAPDTWGDGSGSLEAARGSSHVLLGDATLTGEQDFLGAAWDGARWARQDRARHAWKDGTWRGENLTGKGWKSHTWQTAAWTAADPADADKPDKADKATLDKATGVDWTSSMWHSSMWHSSMWHSSMWHSSMWHSSMWHDEDWSSHSWS
jgi:serine protease AprX